MASSCIIAYCDIASQYYRLTLAEDGRTVIDFSLYFTSPPRSAWQPVELTTDASLRPCPVCGSRIVNQCACMRRLMPCEPLVGFRFSCIYCSYLRLLGPASAL